MPGYAGYCGTPRVSAKCAREPGLVSIVDGQLIVQPPKAVELWGRPAQQQGEADANWPKLVESKPAKRTRGQFARQSGSRGAR